MFSKINNKKRNEKERERKKKNRKNKDLNKLKKLGILVFTYVNSFRFESQFENFEEIKCRNNYPKILRKMLNFKTYF